MTIIKNQPNDEQNGPLSRRDYRKQQRAEQAAFQKRDRERVKAEQRYAKEHPEVAQQVARIDAEIAEQKIQRLKRKLNWGIFWLSVGVICVMLILFFVEF